MSKKKFVAYGNCQLGAAVHFLKQTPMAERFDFRVFLNYQLILGEASKTDMIKAAQNADVFWYQPTGEIYGILGTEELCSSVVPKDAQKISSSYLFNTGFFPIVKHGQWWTGQQVIDEAKRGSDITLLYDTDGLKYDCMERLRDNLNEQSRREETCDIKMADWIAVNYKKTHLFLLCNHPASGLLVELASRVLRLIGEPHDGMRYYETNDANLPGHHSVHPAVIRELGLSHDFEWANRGADHDYFRVLIQELQTKKGEL